MRGLVDSLLRLGRVDVVDHDADASGRSPLRFHGEAGYRLAISLGLVEPATVVRGVQHVYTTALASLVWAPIYGVLGFAVDWFRVRRRRAT